MLANQLAATDFRQPQQAVRCLHKFCEAPSCNRLVQYADCASILQWSIKLLGEVSSPFKLKIS